MTISGSHFIRHSAGKTIEAGRLVKEGEKNYAYGWLDKILNVQESGKLTAKFDYHVDGQISKATYGAKSEEFLWDGLALIHRDGENFINEPAVTGGNPIFGTKSGIMFNDMLGTTLGVKGEKFTKTNLTAFGENLAEGTNKSFYTGKPYIGELGYAFLFRNYRAEQGKWQTADPLGYPDGWNNLAYVNNGVTYGIDWLGGEIIICGEVNGGLTTHWWLEIHRDGEITGASGFYPGDFISAGLYGPGIVKMGSDETHIYDKNKTIQSVYRTTEEQEKALIEQIFKNYYNDPPAYSGLLPQYVCYNYTESLEKIIQDSFGLKPSTHTASEFNQWSKDTVSKTIRTRPE